MEPVVSSVPHLNAGPLAWGGFLAVVAVLMAADLGVFHRKAHAVSVKEAAIWTVIWISLSLGFNYIIYLWGGAGPALNFLIGYLVEYSLSVDNIFVFVLLFTYFKVPAAYQHRVLFWGILSVLVLRGGMIFLGVAFIEKFEWVIDIFGAFLLYTGVRMALSGEEEDDPSKNWVVRLIKRYLPYTDQYDGDKFVTRVNGKRLATQLMFVYLVINGVDVVFAVDSIPAIFGITTDPYLVFTSNICAVMGLRSLYFLLAGVVNQFHYLKLGLAFILAYVGFKMILPDVSGLITGQRLHIDNFASLVVIVVTLALAIGASLVRNRRLGRIAAEEARWAAEEAALRAQEREENMRRVRLHITLPAGTTSIPATPPVAIAPELDVLSIDYYVAVNPVTDHAQTLRLEDVDLHANGHESTQPGSLVETEPRA